MRYADFDIVMLALPRWDGPYSSTAYSLAKELARHTRVFYVDNPFTVKEYFSKRKSPEIQRRKNALLTGTDIFTTPDAAYPNLFAVTPRLSLPINWLPPGRIYEMMARLNDANLSMTLNHIIRIFGIKKYILVNSFNPLIGRYPKLSVKPLLQVYQSVDDISQAPYMGKHGMRLENEAVKRSDFTIVTSSQLRTLKSAFSDNVFLLPNAANTSLFQRAIKEDLPVPEEIRQLPEGRKVICYTGNICQRLDYELLKRVATAHSDKTLLMIGPPARNDYETSGLSKLPNVIFTGRKPIGELPAYLKHSHCSIIPFLCNQLTKSIYPLKINEYLSAGKPVVTTKFSEDIVSFSKIAYLSETAEQFIRNIDKAIGEDNDVNRIERMIFSSSNNWEARARHFIDLTVEFLKRNDRGRTTPGRREHRAQAVYR